MSNVLMLLPVLVPILFWAYYHYHKDRHLPEPPGHLLLAFVFGIVSAGISKALYFGLGLVNLRFDALYLADTDTAALFLYSLLAIGPIEELAKLMPFLLVVVRFREFDEPLDGIIYASFIALGYAATENLLYLDMLTPLGAIARGFAGPVVHMLFASIWGIAIACAHVRGDSLIIAALKGFLVAAVLHGLYDFAVLQDSFNALPIAGGFIVAVWIWRLRLMRMLHEQAKLAVPSKSGRESL